MSIYANYLYGPYVDKHGLPIQRTPMTHPYSFEGYVQERRGPNEDVNDSCYSDRMFQWDHEKYDRLARKHFGKPTQVFDSSFASFEKIEAFLQDYFGNPDIKLIYVMKHCNQASGYPLWSFHFNKPE